MEYQFLVNGIEVKANYHEEDVEMLFKPLLRKWKQLQKEKEQRIFVFLAAPAGCGKTTLSLFLEYLSKQDASLEEIQAIGMDGFHFTNAYLMSHTFEEDGKVMLLKERKGNCMTFDKEGLKNKIVEGRMKDNLWPIYSREIHDPIEDKIKLDKKIILIEGNYLLLNEKGWEDLISYSDDTVFIKADAKMLKERLVNRKIAGGFSKEEAEAFYENSDRKNVEQILNCSHEANLTILMEGYRFKKI